MGKFEILEIKASKKTDKRGQLRDIAKVKLLMKDHVREDLYEYLLNE